eukprot:gene4878-8472_t
MSLVTKKWKIASQKDYLWKPFFDSFISKKFEKTLKNLKELYIQKNGNLFIIKHLKLFNSRIHPKYSTTPWTREFSKLRYFITIVPGDMSTLYLHIIEYQGELYIMGNDFHGYLMKNEFNDEYKASMRSVIYGQWYRTAESDKLEKFHFKSIIHSEIFDLFEKVDKSILPFFLHIAVRSLRDIPIREAAYDFGYDEYFKMSSMSIPNFSK